MRAPTIYVMSTHSIVIIAHILHIVTVCDEGANPSYCNGYIL